MGAETFYSTATGKTAKEAFWSAMDEARYEYGSGGYTGSIAEKDEFVMIEVPDGHDPIEYADKLNDECDDRVCDKWGPAGCVKVKEGVYYFFGNASS